MTEELAEKLAYEAEGVTVYLGDCLEALAHLPEASVDSVVCDPPYFLEFMGRAWDKPGDVRQIGDETFKENAAYPGRVRHGGAPSYGEDPAASKSLQRRMQAWHQKWAEAVYRVLKPGGHLVSFGGTRTSHRLACAIEDAGFEIRDSIAWMRPGEPGGGDATEASSGPLAWIYGSGFP